MEMNIAEILKECPAGMKLYSPAFGELFLEEVVNNEVIYTYQEPTNKDWITFLSDGRHYNKGECVLFPSRDQRDWSKFKVPVEPPFDLHKDLEEYYTFDMFGGVGEMPNKHNNTDNELWEFGNHFDTREQAEYAVHKVKELLLSLRKETK